MSDLINVEFNSEKHEYSADGTIYPSVTTIIQDCGACKGSNFYTEDSRLKGIQRHSLISDHLLGKVDFERVDELGYTILERLQTFYESEVLEVIQVEKPMIDKDMGYAGTPDFIYRSKDGAVLVDWKNTTHAEWHKVQLAAYANLYGWFNISQLAIVYTNTVKWKKAIVEQPWEYWEVFQAMLKIYQFKHRGVKNV